MTVSARLGPYLTTLPVCHRSSAAPLGRIDYNVDILSPVPACERLLITSAVRRKAGPWAGAQAHSGHAGMFLV